MAPIAHFNHQSSLRVDPNNITKVGLSRPAHLDDKRSAAVDFASFKWLSVQNQPHYTMNEDGTSTLVEPALPTHLETSTVEKPPTTPSIQKINSSSGPALHNTKASAKTSSLRWSPKKKSNAPLSVHFENNNVGCDYSAAGEFKSNQSDSANDAHYNSQPVVPSRSPESNKKKKAIRYTGYVATLGILYLVRRHNKKKKKKHPSVDESIDSLPTNQLDDHDDAMYDTDDDYTDDQMFADITSPILEHFEAPPSVSSLPVIIHSFKDANSGSTSSVPHRLFDPDIKTDDRKWPVQAAHNNEMADLMDAHGAELDKYKQEDNLLLKQLSEITFLSLDKIACRDAEIEKNNVIIDEKMNQLAAVIDTCEAEMATCKDKEVAQQTEISHLKDELVSRDAELTKCYKAISYLNNEFKMLKGNSEISSSNRNQYIETADGHSTSNKPAALKRRPLMGTRMLGLAARNN